jgi:hypothetical protein
LGGQKLGRTNLVVFAVNADVVGGGIDSVREYADEHDGQLPYTEFNIDASLEEVLLAFKRFDVVLINKVLKQVRKYRRINAVDEP